MHQSGDDGFATDASTHPEVLIERAYGLLDVEVERIPRGYTARCYSISRGAQTWVLKIWETGHPDSSSAGRRRSLRLIQELIALRPNIRLPEPVATRRGSLTARVPGGGAALYRFVSGGPAQVSHQAPDRLLETIGAAAAEIHSLTPRLTVAVADNRPADLQRIRWMRHALSSLPELDGQPPARLIGVVTTRRMSILFEQLDRLRDLRRRLSPPGRQVLRHGDLQGDNLRVDGSLPLGVLDWDEAALDAPEREFGLFLLDGGRRVLDRVLNSYVRAGGVAALDMERIELAALERHLVDLAARFERVLGADEQNAREALEDVASWGLRRIDRLTQARS